MRDCRSTCSGNRFVCFPTGRSNAAHHDPIDDNRHPALKWSNFWQRHNSEVAVIKGVLEIFSRHPEMCRSTGLRGSNFGTISRDAIHAQKSDQSPAGVRDCDATTPTHLRSLDLGSLDHVTGPFRVQISGDTDEGLIHRRHPYEYVLIPTHSQDRING